MFFHRLFDARLNRYRLWLFGWCLDDCHVAFLLLLVGVVLRSVLRLAFSDSCTQPKHGHASCVTGGSDPKPFWAAESRTKWGRSRPSECLVRVQMSPVSFTHPPIFEESAVGLWVTLGLGPHLRYHVSVSRHPIFSYCRR